MAPSSGAAGFAALALVSAVLLAACDGRSEGAPEARETPVASPGALLRTSGFLASRCPDCDPPAVPESFRRPLRALRADGAACRPSKGRNLTEEFAVATGAGPVYAAGLGRVAKIGVDLPPVPGTVFEGSDWGGAKVLWIAAPDYDGAALVRGWQLDGTDPVGFEETTIPNDELQLPPLNDYTQKKSGWRHWPSYVRFKAPGCYALQIDGDGFSDTIVVEVSAR